MSQIAEQTGIGRATLYKYFPDVETILLAWHDREITAHLRQLAEIRDRISDPARRLEAVLETYALIHQQPTRHHRHAADLVAFLHRDHHFIPAKQQLHTLIRDLLADAAAATGQVRDDTTPDELTTYCLHALNVASTLPSKAAIRRLVGITLAGLQPPR